MNSSTISSSLSNNFNRDNSSSSNIWLSVRKLAVLIVLVMTLTAVSSLSAYADRRNYVWTYQYVTMPKNVTELEFYQTTKVKDKADGNIVLRSNTD